jgi:Amt family ammonium transporter
LVTVLAVSWATTGVWGQDPAPATPPAATEPATPPADAPAPPAEAAAPAETPAAEAAPAEAAPAPSQLDKLSYAFDTFVMMIMGVLVIFMQAGFAMVEAGLNHRKNVINILTKNMMDFCFGALLFFAVGYGLMYAPIDKPIIGMPYKLEDGTEKSGAVFNFGGFGIGSYGSTNAIAGGSHSKQTDFLFQVAFAATAATIVSGAVAGRIKFSAYIIYTLAITGFIYPVSGYWKWGYGFLNDWGFYDFAGSVVVHAVGGFCGLAGAIMLGPRIGKFGPDGKARPMPGHNQTLTALGVFVLLIGWYGFNPGSQLMYYDDVNINSFSLIAVNTTLAACAGACVSMLLAWILFGKPDFTMAANGMLAGLVGITANCDSVTNLAAIIIGAIAGALVVSAIIALDKIGIDDPVGAFPVHGVCGMWGGIATGVTAFHLPKEICEQMGRGEVTHQLLTQVQGTLIISAWAFLAALILFGILRVVGLLRVSPEEEEKGLDIGEHGMEAYVL